ncbi:MAG: ubiquinone/menaquinone biosynthesis C-methylase UbiE, partial [Planctomycetota bacterium]
AACASTQDSADSPSEIPTPIEPQIAKDINKAFLDKDLDVGDFTKRFEGESREVFVNRKEIAQAMKLETGMAVADIGAGTGLFLKPIGDQVGESGIVYAVDISPVFITHLRERAQKDGLPQVQPVLCGQRSCDLPEASVDAAFICDTYHHFEYPASTLASLFSAIRAGGELLIVDFERIPGKTSEWLMKHVRAGKEVFRSEIEAAGFVFIEEVNVGLEENYFLRFRRPGATTQLRSLGYGN